MPLSYPGSLVVLKPKDWWNIPSFKGCLDLGLKARKRARTPIMSVNTAEERIRKAIPKVELSASSYDTAWVAMVPSPNFPQLPCFPETIDWILENQHPDGSWGFVSDHPSLIRYALSSTLACILALRRWNVGEEHIRRGLSFIGSNFRLAMNQKLPSPIGFDMVFAYMISYALEIGLKFSMSEADLDFVFRMMALELERDSVNITEGRKAYLAYVAEGSGGLQDWKEVMKYQRRNGSLFNSPAATAAAFTHTQDSKASEYLHKLLQKFGRSVPSIYPVDIYAQLFIIDNLERLGIAGHFGCEIKSILDRVYRCWVQSDDEIVSDLATQAMAFRLLRMNGYDISSEAFIPFDEERSYQNTLQGYLKDVTTVLELYKASEIKIFPNEHVLDKLNSWSSKFLRELSTNAIHKSQEVDYYLKYPFYANLERLEHKRNIEHYNAEDFQILKGSYICPRINKECLLEFALESFNLCQSLYQKELKDLERWVEENKLDQLKFARQKLTYCYFSAAATLFSPELSDARMAWAKNGVLTTVVDDFFDIGGSTEELLNFISLIERWDGNHQKQCCSEQVSIVFSALFGTTNQLGAKASMLQDRTITDHLVQIWLSLAKSMMREAEWLRNQSVPTMDDYMTNGYVSFALGPIVLPALYLVGPKLSEDAIRNPEYHNLFKLMSTCGRLLNDIQGFERDGNEGKLNSVSLHILHSCGSISEEDAKREVKSMVDSARAELLRLVLQTEGSILPRACKELFWKMSRVLHVFYRSSDGFTSPKEMFSAVNAVIHEPLQVSH